MSVPLLYVWDGAAMTPMPHFRKLAGEAFKVGRLYRLAEAEPRSATSHRHYFAVINEAWLNMPETEREQWLTPDELRKWCLTFTGWRTIREYPARTETEAIRVMKYLQGDERYSRVEVDRETNIVRQIIPMSQSEPAMSRTDFQKSKDDVFRVLAEKLGVDVDTLTREAGNAA
jgi:hypothetical protein